MSNILAPLRIIDLCATDLQFTIIGSPVDDMRLNIQEQHRTSDLETSKSGDCYTLDLDLDLDADLLNPEDRDHPLLHSHATINIKVSVSKEIDNSGEDPRRYLEANAVSIAYSHARSSLMMLAGLTPVQTFVLPAILPYNAIENKASGDK